jgi:hypothetical protein
MAAPKKPTAKGTPGNPKNIMGTNGKPLSGAEVKKYAEVDKATVSKFKSDVAASKKKPAKAYVSKPTTPAQQKKYDAVNKNMAANLRAATKKSGKR